MGKTIPERIRNKINSTKYDLQAEVVISEIMNKLKSEDKNFLIDFQGQFKRPYRKDILDAEIVDYEYDATQFVKVNISRDGIYDILPESLFHKQINNKNKISVDEMAQNYKTHKKEEKDARNFFFPFENELFIKSLEREDLEKELLLELNGSKPIDFFYEFWEFDRNEISEILLARLMRLLPYAYKIAGNQHLTAYCLGYLLDEKVEIFQTKKKNLSAIESEISLGGCKLGIDTALGNIYTDYSLLWEIRIGEIKNASFMEYIHNGKLKKFLDLFVQYFIPIDIDLKTTLLLNKKIDQFILNENSVLDVNTSL